MLFDDIRTKLSDQLGVDEDEITLETNIVEDLGADSLDVVELLTACEDEQGVVIPDDEIGKIKTVGDLIKAIESLK